MAMTASTGWLGMLTTAVEDDDPSAGVLERGVFVPKLSPPSKSVAVAPAWTREPLITLRKRKQPICRPTMPYALRAS